jgi:hypothetical protein
MMIQQYRPATSGAAVLIGANDDAYFGNTAPLM